MEFIAILIMFLVGEPWLGLIGAATGTSEGVKFVAMGDWGGLSFHPWTTPVQTSVADQMAIMAKTQGLDFVVLLGDNFYLYGVQSVNDHRFTDTFENVYNDPALQRPWYVIAGNHDYFGNVSAQIAYSKRSRRWIFPDYYHSFRRNIPGGKVLDVVLIDTIQLCGNVFTTGQQPAGPTDVAAAEAQWLWIETQLNTSSADYLVVAGHYPIYSAAAHGPTDCLQERLEPMLYKYNVTAYLAGHDHTLQHIQVIKHGHIVDHVIAGAANFVENRRDHLNSVPRGALKFFSAEMLYLGGFTYYDVTDVNMTVKFVDGTGKTRHKFTASPRTT